LCKRIFHFIHNICKEWYVFNCHEITSSLQNKQNDWFFLMHHLNIINMSSLKCKQLYKWLRERFLHQIKRGVHLMMITARKLAIQTKILMIFLLSVNHNDIYWQTISLQYHSVYIDEKFKNDEIKKKTCHYYERYYR